VASLKKSALSRLRWLVLAPIPLAWCVIAHFGFLSFLEDKVIDWRFAYRGPIDAPARVVYVNIDPASLAKIGGWPWSREYFATVVRDLIAEGGAKAVGMDVVFDDEGRAESVDVAKLIKGNLALGRYLRDSQSVIVGASYTALDFRDVNGQPAAREFPDLNRPDLPALRLIEPPELPSFNVGPHRPQWHPPGVALIDTVDGGTRLAWLFAPTAERTYFTMGIELARIYYGVERDGVKVTDKTIDLVRPDGTLAARIPLYRKQMLEINWFSKWLDAGRNPYVGISTAYGYSQMLASDDPANQKTAKEFYAQFKDAVVLIGPTDILTFHDAAPTPLDARDVPKVSVHGNLFKTIVSGRYIRRLPEWGAFAAIFLLSALVTALALGGGGRAVFAKVMAVLSAVLYIAAAFALFKTSDLIIPVVAPIGAALTSGVVALLWQIVEEQKQKGRIKGMFGAYVAPALVARMVDSGEEPTLGGIEENITAYFSDIQSFSSFSEKLSPARLVELMNEYLTACTDIIQAEGGTLDKYIGDAVVAIYNAPISVPDHGLRAAVAALRVHRRCTELREKWDREGERWPDIVRKLQTRIGLNTGSCVVGNMGSHTRFNYTMMGDNVNIAARMESGAKSWGVYTMCTESTRAECERLEAGRIVFRPLGRIIVKGRSTPLPIFELAALKEDATDSLRQCIAIFEQGMAKYYARDWDGAIELFRQSEPLEPNGVGRVPGSSNNPSLVYIAIAEGYREEPPPPGWDGVFEMKEK
jgi:adenylate cyclase